MAASEREPSRSRDTTENSNATDHPQRKWQCHGSSPFFLPPRRRRQAGAGRWAAQSCYRCVAAGRCWRFERACLPCRPRRRRPVFTPPIRYCLSPVARHAFHIAFIRFLSAFARPRLNRALILPIFAEASH